MISKIVTRGLSSLARSSFTSASGIVTLRCNFSRNVTPKTPASFSSVVDAQIKNEMSNQADVKKYEEFFSQHGYTIKRDNTVVEAEAVVGKFKVRLISSIKPPSNGAEEAEGQEKDENEENYDGETNEINVYITKQGSQKTMCISTIVEDSYNVSNVMFYENFQTAKKLRNSFFVDNVYTGPLLQTIDQSLFETIHDFMEKEVKVNNELLVQFADYCIDSEQSFYVQWLKDLRSFL